MILGTITQKGFNLECDTNSIPMQYSAEIPIKFIKDDAYKDYAAIPAIGYYDCSNENCITVKMENDIFKLPYEVFKNDGEITIAIALTNENETIVTGNVNLRVRKAPGGVNILPSEHEWQSIVRSFLEQYIEVQINPKIQSLADEAINQQDISKQLQLKVNTAVESCGKYTFENQTLRFQQADGTFGDPIHLEGQSTVFLDDAAQNMELKTIRAPNLEKIKLQMIVDGKNVLVETTADQIYVSDDLKLDEVLGGNMFFIEQNDSYLGLGNYEEWMQKGKPKA